MIEVKLRNKNNPQAEPVCLTLPASHEDEAAAKTKLGMKNLSECTFTFELPDDLPHAENIFHNMKREKRFWQELNFFARQLNELSHDDRALLDHSPEDMKAAINLPYHLENIVVAAGIHTSADLGRFQVSVPVIKCKKPPGKKCRFLAVVGWKYATLKPVCK